MLSQELLDFPALLAPIPGGQPAGTSVPFAIREQLEKARKEEDPDDYAPDDPRRPDKRTGADWATILRLTQSVLQQQSKDLQMAARLTEALLKSHGFAGLRDGLRLLRLLVEQCWDRLYPPVEGQDDLEIRAGAFFWLDDPDHGACLPSSLRMVPLLADDSGSYSWLEWRQAQQGKGAVTREALDRATLVTPREALQAALADLTQGREEIVQSGRLLSEKIGPAAPGLTNLRQSVEDCLALVQQILQRKPTPAAAPAPNGPPVAGPAAVTPRPAPARPAATREEAYGQLAQAAALLKELEPHSPIPYLVQRAVELGGLSFPELMIALIREPAVLADLNRELGIKVSPPQPPT
jgi:type VI secretion system protein ImpA